MASNTFFYYTHKKRSYDISAVNVPPASLNDHFLLLPSRLLQSLMGNTDHNGYVWTVSMLDFCRERRGLSRAFHIPLRNVYGVGRLITGLKNTKSMGPDDVPARLLKLALPYIVEPLTYKYNLCIQKSVFPNVQNSQSSPSPKEYRQIRFKQI